MNQFILRKDATYVIFKKVYSCVEVTVAAVDSGDCGARLRASPGPTPLFSVHPSFNGVFGVSRHRLLNDDTVRDNNSAGLQWLLRSHRFLRSADSLKG